MKFERKIITFNMNFKLLEVHLKGYLYVVILKIYWREFFFYALRTKVPSDKMILSWMKKKYSYILIFYEARKFNEYIILQNSLYFIFQNVFVY